MKKREREKIPGYRWMIAANPVFDHRCKIGCNYLLFFGFISVIWSRIFGVRGRGAGRRGTASRVPEPENPPKRITLRTMEKNLLWLGGLAALSATGCTGPAAKPERPMNILYIMTDDHTAQMMSCYDRRYASTPNLDRIAAEGVRFTNSFVANSLSGPSRACMLTGKHSHANGYTDNTSCAPFDGSQPTFPKLLQAAGYQTALVGKWHLGSRPTGFDHWEIIPGQGDYYNPLFICRDDTVRVDGYLTNIITDKSIAWLENGRDSGKPFCLLVHHKAQHRNWMADTCHLALYEDREFELPETFFDDYAGRPAAAAQEMSVASDHDMDPVYDLKMRREGVETRLSGSYEGMLGRLDAAQRAAWDRFYGPVIEEFYRTDPQGRERAQWKFNRYIRDYLKTLKSLDDNVGRLLDYLEASGLAGNTLVVYTSDQGFYMGEHGWFDKRFMYEESMRTPLVMRLPGGVKGDIDALVQNIDYAPTFLELAGAPVPDDMQGCSLLPLLRGEVPAGWRRSLYYHFYEYPAEHMVKRHYGVRGERWKLIHFYDDIDHWELYDLATDPQELHNRYGDPACAAEQAQLHDELVRLQRQYGDTLALGKNEN